MDKKSFTPSQIDEIRSAGINRSKAKNFLQCESCIKEFTDSLLGDILTSREYGLHEASFYTFIYPGGNKVDILVLWCKRCGGYIWDSRNLFPIY